MSTLNSAQEAVDTVANQAIYAALQQTFAVGGAIINNATGELIAVMHNNVLMPFPGNTTTFFLPHDPTAHGERQLVDWYYQNAARLSLPPPNQLTIVTTLDPCAMCAGSLLTAGFNVAVSAIDDYAGINYNSQFNFPTLPPQIRQQAQNTWAYYAIAAPVSRAYQGSTSPVFGGQSIDSAAYFLCSSIFSASVNTVRDASNNSGLPPDQLKNPATLPANSKVRQALTALSPFALTVQSANPRDPGAELAPGIQSSAAFGHTPGMAVFTVRSEGQSFMYTADVTNVPSLFARSPDWAVAFDMDAEMARQTRRRVFDMLVKEKTVAGGFHFPFPAFGTMEAAGNGYQFKPMA